MEEKRIRSRILEYLPKDLLLSLNRICETRRTTDNNEKVELMKQALDSFNIDYIELGPGTNRYAILIDNYVFKIALDAWGVRDNLNEFVVTEDLIEFAAKTYETNGLIVVAEYVTIISREEFMENKEQIRLILESLEDSFLLGDVGTVEKNFCNWGYRDDGSIVMLDYAYVYRVLGLELKCSTENCGAMLGYDENYHSLVCPRCRKKYTFIDIRRKIDKDLEIKEQEEAKSEAYKLTEPLVIIKNNNDTNNSVRGNQEEELNMGKKNKIKFDEYTEEPMSFDDILNIINIKKNGEENSYDFSKDGENEDTFESYGIYDENIKNAVEHAIVDAQPDDYVSANEMYKVLSEKLHVDISLLVGDSEYTDKFNDDVKNEYGEDSYEDDSISDIIDLMSNTKNGTCNINGEYDDNSDEDYDDDAVMEYFNKVENGENVLTNTSETVIIDTDQEINVNETIKVTDKIDDTANNEPKVETSYTRIENDEQVVEIDRTVTTTEIENSNVDRSESITPEFDEYLNMTENDEDDNEGKEIYASFKPMQQIMTESEENEETVEDFVVIDTPKVDINITNNNIVVYDAVTEDSTNSLSDNEELQKLRDALKED